MEPPPTVDRVTGRSLAKGLTRAALLSAAAQRFAERGYTCFHRGPRAPGGVAPGASTGISAVSPRCSSPC
jgi:hypothetical protein